MVRAKFKVQRIESTLHWQPGKGELKTIVLQPVTGGSDENKSFFDSTPCGEIRIGTLSGDAAAAFELGAEYYVDFSRAG